MNKSISSSGGTVPAVVSGAWLGSDVTLKTAHERKPTLKTPLETEVAALVMREASRGARIAQRVLSSKSHKWREVKNPAWNWGQSEYRVIASAPEVDERRPWSAEVLSLPNTEVSHGPSAKTK